MSANELRFFTSADLNDPLESLVALLISLGFLQTSPDAHVFAQKYFAVVLEPVEHLLDILEKQVIEKTTIRQYLSLFTLYLLEQPQRESLVQFDLLRMPLGLESAMMSQDIVNYSQHMRCSR